MRQPIWFGKYRILGLLGKGGNSEVYLAEHIKLNSFRAIKFISKNHPLYDLQCKEALILKNLKHSCIPIIYDIEENEDGSYIVEEYLNGQTLRTHVMEKGPIKENLILQLGLQLCDLISYLHSLNRTILYVDFKPDNIILSDLTLKLIDFGSAVYLDELSDHQEYYGTRGYAAPELYRDGKIDERSDVYGIGMLMYFMATGQDSNNQAAINHIDYIGNCSNNMKKVINNCLKYYASQRYTTVTGLSKELSALIKTNKQDKESSQKLLIAVAGAQQRIGVTHLAFRICKYMQNQGSSFLYEEKNSSGCVRSIASCYEDCVTREGLYWIEGIPMLPLDQQHPTGSGEFHIMIQDFGILAKDNLEQFLMSDVKIVIMGSKEWELKFSEQVIRLTSEYKDIVYLFNYLNGRQFQRVINSMGKKYCLRVPYEPDPFTNDHSKNEADFMGKLIPMIRKSKFKNGLIKGERIYEAKADLT